jgi:hypothetical protein
MNEEEFTSWRCCLLALLRIDATKPKEDCEEKIKSLQLANKYISINASIAFLIYKRYIPDPEQLNQQRFKCAAQMRETLYTILNAIRTLIPVLVHSFSRWWKPFWGGDNICEFLLKFFNNFLRICGQENAVKFIVFVDFFSISN